MKAATLLMGLGLLCGLAGQIELLRPGILFMGPEMWPNILNLHIWITTLAAIVICVSAVTVMSGQGAAAQWAIWFGFALLPLLIGALINVNLRNTVPVDSYLSDTYYVTAGRHAFGLALLLVTLGAFSAVERAKSKRLSLIVTLIFAFLITASGIAMVLFQAGLGLNGLPRKYIDYPEAFAQGHFFAGLGAIACLGGSAAYIMLLWRFSKDGTDETGGRL